MKSIKILSWLVLGFLILGGILCSFFEGTIKEVGFAVASFALFPFLGIIVALVIRSFKE